MFTINIQLLSFINLYFSIHTTFIQLYIIIIKNDKIIYNKINNENKLNHENNLFC